MQAIAVIAKARLLLSDPGKVRWSDQDLLGWLNSAQLAIVAVRPDAKSVRVDMLLAAGAEQALPAEGLRLLSVLHNVGGRGITLISRDELEAGDLYWQTAKPRDQVKHYMFDADTPRLFDVYPPAVAGTKVRVSMATTPKACETLTSNIDLDDLYEGALIDGVCSRAWMQDGDNPNDKTRAADHLALFMQGLTGKTQADESRRPQRK